MFASESNAKLQSDFCRINDVLVPISRRQFLTVTPLASFAPSSLFANDHPPPLEAFGRLPELEMPMISPSGRRLVCVASIGGDRRVIAKALDATQKSLVQLRLNDVKLREIAWIDDRYFIGFTSSAQYLSGAVGFSREFGNFFVADCDTGNVNWPMQHRRRLNALFGYYGTRKASGGNWKAYVGAVATENSLNREVLIDSDTIHLLEIDLSTSESRLMAAEPENHRRWVIGAKSEILAHDRYDPKIGEWTLYRGKSSDAIVKIKDPEQRCSLLGLGRQANTVVFRMPSESDDIVYREIDLGAELPAPIQLPIEINSSRPFFDSKTHLVIGYVKRNASQVFPRLFDRKLQARLDGVCASLPNSRLSFSSANEDFTEIAFHSEGESDAGTWWHASIKKGTADELGWSYPEVKRKDVGAWQTITHKADDGVEIEGFLTLPPTKTALRKPHALVVLPHGGPASHDNEGFDWWAQAFASRGYAVWQPNFRGSTGYGEAFRKLGYKQWGKKMQTDLSDGVAELVKLGVADPKHVAIVGASYGGYAALAGVTLQQNVYRCAVSFSGLSDLNAFAEHLNDRSGKYAREYFLRYFDSEYRVDDTLRALSPSKHAPKVNVPVLLIHGKDDAVVPIVQSRIMAKALREANKPFELVELEDEDHWLSREKTRISMLKACVSFVQKHNPIA
jgi:pimeloyl-ACP methyl ester carboxylesterase